MLSLLRIPKPFNPSKIDSRGYTKHSGFGIMGFSIDRLLNFQAPGNQRDIAAPHKPDQLQNRRTGLMKYALLLIFPALVFGGAHASRSMGGGLVGSANVSARTAAELYSRHCASCHGRDGRAKTLKGKLKHARDLADSDWQNRISDERIFNSIMNGKGKMPAYGKKLSEQEIDPLVTYVRALRK
jgi:mono/diheme cytochrome c family protein